MKINVYRSNFVESTHEVTTVVINSNGKVLFSSGDTQKKIFPRSAIKPLQAIPFVQSGAFDFFNCSLQELACACASHSGEAIHVSTITNWLHRMSLSIQDLECGQCAPHDKRAYDNFILKHEVLSDIFNNCSGKHAGQLALAKFLHVETKNYVHRKHPVQELIFKAVKDICCSDMGEDDYAIDGCSIPTYWMKIQDVAMGMAQLAKRSQSSGLINTNKNKNENKNQNEERAFQLIYKAFTENPDLTAGTKEFCTLLMKKTKSHMLVKMGAEGIMAVSIPELNLGICLKVHDGASRAAEVAIICILQQLSQMDEFHEPFQRIFTNNFEKKELELLSRTPIFNRSHQQVGHLEQAQ